MLTCTYSAHTMAINFILPANITGISQGVSQVPQQSIAYPHIFLRRPGRLSFSLRGRTAPFRISPSHRRNTSAQQVQPASIQTGHSIPKSHVHLRTHSFFIAPYSLDLPYLICHHSRTHPTLAFTHLICICKVPCRQNVS